MQLKKLWIVPIGLTYNWFIQQLAEVLFADTEKNRIDYIYNFILFVSIVSIVIAYTTLTSNKRYKNDIIKYGILLGSAILVIYSSNVYWKDITNESKLLVISALLAILFLYAY